VSHWLTNLQRKQQTFATAGALTDTVFDVRKHVVETENILEIALAGSKQSPSALAMKLKDKKSSFVSKRLSTCPAFIVIEAAKKYKDKASTLNQTR